MACSRADGIFFARRQQSRCKVARQSRFSGREHGRCEGSRLVGLRIGKNMERVEQDGIEYRVKAEIVEGWRKDAGSSVVAPFSSWSECARACDGTTETLSQISSGLGHLE